MNTEDEAAAELISAARAAMKHAHAPYSRFAVGAAVRLIDGKCISGANLENASYGLSLCAEAVAIAAVHAQGRLPDISAIALVGGRIDQQEEQSGAPPVTPCGRCRQLLHESEQIAGRSIDIFCAPPQGDAMMVHSVASLLPFAFGPHDLPNTPVRKS